MARELIKIQASFLRPGKLFAREIFLRMPKNQKMLRIVLPGDEIRPALLARLLITPDAELFAQPLEADPSDPAALDLYGENAEAVSEPSYATEPAPARAENSFDSFLPAAQSKTFEPEGIDTIRKSLAPGSIEEQATSLRPDNFIEEQTQISASPGAPEEATAFHADGGELDVEKRLIADEDFSAERRKRANTWSQETEERIAGEEASQELASHIGASEQITDNSESAFSPDPETPAEQAFLAAGRLDDAVKQLTAPKRQRRDKDFSLGTLLGLAAESFADYAAHPASSDEETRHDLASALAEAFSEITRRESAGSEIPQVLQALRDSLGRVSEAVTTSDLAAPPTAGLASLSEHLSAFVAEYRVAVEQPAEEAAFEKKLEQVAEEFIAYGEQTSPEEGAAELLRDKLGACIAEIEARLAADRSPSPDLLTVRSSLQQAIASLPLTSRGAKAYRETPQIAARLASLLAHSLGYASPRFLYDVAFTAHLFFAEKNGSPLSPGELPPIAAELLGRPATLEEAGTPLGDSAAILQFLDRYFENPNCDRTQKEFGRRVFETTLNETSPNEWTAARWRYFVQQGPSLTALSLCAKASAKANKVARGLTSDVTPGLA